MCTILLSFDWRRIIRTVVHFDVAARAWWRILALVLQLDALACGILCSLLWRCLALVRRRILWLRHIAPVPSGVVFETMMGPARAGAVTGAGCVVGRLIPEVGEGRRGGARGAGDRRGCVSPSLPLGLPRYKWSRIFGSWLATAALTAASAAEK